MQGTSIHIAGFCGSLRKESYNKKLLLIAQKLLEADGCTFQLLSTEMPPYNADEDTPLAQSRPQAVEQCRQQLQEADGLLIVSPEYNYSLPGHLKNALDWASRGGDSPLRNKPVAVIGASTSMTGTARMQVQVLSIFLYMDMKPVYQPEVMIADAANKFDEQGQLTNVKSFQLLRKKLAALQQLILQEKSAKEAAYK
ncbi:MAG TPA: NAD(P)H-dependent oxidoreductase [Lacibacter sp.]|nr:NAD(P)H-dependent oxidoreductase [Lacibacter sp.]